ncbi:AF4/FMR2 family member lilli-like [Dermacentor albipictus]|uniref:AF4/FMR2 family member lilli-like n=1 Tax=Dermacentor albipictus TaxID=60249 RepID=UPI0031FD0723
MARTRTCAFPRAAFDPSCKRKTVTVLEPTMSDQPPTKNASEPSVPTQSEGGEQEEQQEHQEEQQEQQQEQQQSPWQTALRYFNEIYVNGSKQPPQGEPSTDDGPLSGLQKALDWMADRTLVRTSVTLESGSASNSTAARDEQSPLSKALDYVSLSVFAPEMLPSSDSRSSIGVTVVRPPSRSCLRDVRSAPSIKSGDSAPARSRSERYRPRPSAPQLPAPAIRNRYRLKLVPSAVQRRRPPQRATASRATQSEVSQPSSQSGPQYHYLSFAGGQPSCCVVLPSSAPLPYNECSCCSECRCGNRFPDPLEIFRTFSQAYRAFGLQQNPFGMTCLLPYWPMPQHPYYFYPPGPIVPPLETWTSSRSSDSSCVCEQCGREVKQRRLAPAKAVHDFSTLVQAAPMGKRIPQKKSLSKREVAAVTDTTSSKPADGTEISPVEVPQGPEVTRKESQPSDSIGSDADQTAAPKGSRTIQQPANNQPGDSTARSGEAPKVMQSARTAEDTTSPEEPKATSASVAPPLQPAEAMAQVQPLVDGVLPVAQPRAHDGSLEPQVQPPAGPVSTAGLATVQHGLPSIEQSAAVESMQPGVHEEKRPSMQEKQPGTDEKKQPAAQGNQPDRHKKKQAGAEVAPLDPNILPGQQSDTSKDPATASAAAPPKHGLPAPQLPETRLSVPQPPNLQATMPENSTAEFSLSPETIKSMSEIDTLQPPNVPRSDSLLPNNIPGTNAEPQPPKGGMQNAPADNQGIVGGLIATGTTAAAAAQKSDDSSHDPSKKVNAAGNEEPGASDTISKRSSQSDKAGEPPEHHDYSSNAEHIMDMLRPDLPMSEEQAINIEPAEPAAGVQPAQGDGAKPDNDAAHAEQGDEKPAETDTRAAATQNNFNSAIMGCAAIFMVFIILVVVYSIMSSASGPPPENVVTETPHATLMFDIEHYNGSRIMADEEETTHINPLDF